MKTRRGFFTALVGAVAAPLAMVLAKSGVGKALGEKKTHVVAHGAAETGFRIQNIRFISGPNRTIESDLDSGVVTITEYLPIADVSKRYPEYMGYYDISSFKMWPEPPVYPIHFHPWPWENANWHRLGQIPLERTVTVTDPDGGTRSVTINQNPELGQNV